jgi:endonuclease YncB( thermonuclease family)
MDIIALTCILALARSPLLFTGLIGSGTSGRPAPRADQEPPGRAAPRPFAPVRAMPRTLSGKAWVIDGDTIVIGTTKVRLAGIDAPELDQPFGRKSKWAMVDICKGQVITAELTGEWSHDRLVGTCYLPDGRDIGGELVRRGLALDWPTFSGGRYRHLEPAGVRRRMRARFGR